MVLNTNGAVLGTSLVVLDTAGVQNNDVSPLNIDVLLCGYLDDSRTADFCVA